MPGTPMIPTEDEGEPCSCQRSSPNASVAVGAGRTVEREGYTRHANARHFFYLPLNSTERYVGLSKARAAHHKSRTHLLAMHTLALLYHTGVCHGFIGRCQKAARSAGVTFYSQKFREGLRLRVYVYRTTVCLCARWSVVVQSL